MDIRCEKCGAVYEFPEENIPPEGLMVKCEECGHVFRVEPPSPHEEEKEFMVRKQDGTVLHFTHLETLQEWILDGVVGRNDEISSTGDSWAPLGILPELEEYFTEYERLQAPVKIQPVRSTKEFAAGHMPEPLPAPVDDSLRPPVDDDEPELSGAQLSTAGETDDEPRLSSSSFTVDEGEEYPYAPSASDSRSSAMWWVIALIMLVGGGAVGAMFYIGVLPSPFAPASEVADKEIAPVDAQQPNPSAILDESWKILATGTEDAFTRSMDILEKCAAPSCLLRRALILSTWVFYLDEDAAIFALKWPKELSEDRKRKRLSVLRAKRDAKLKEAKASLEKALKSGTGAGARAVEAFIEIMEGHKVRALELLEQTSAEKSPDVRFMRGLAYYKAGMADRAIKELQVFSDGRYGGRFLPALFALGRIYESKQDVIKAHELFSSVCDANPSFFRACAMSRDLMEAAQKAREDKKTAATKSGSVPASRKSGMRHKKVVAGDKDSAPSMDAYDRYFSKAEEAYRSGDKLRAERYYLKAAKADPTSPDAWNGAGYCNLDLGRYDRAVRYFRKALTIAPSFSTAQYGMAEALMRSGRRRAALRAYKKYLEIAPPGRGHVPRVRLLVSKLEEEFNPMASQEAASPQDSENPATAASQSSMTAPPVPPSTAGGQPSHSAGQESEKKTGPDDGSSATSDTEKTSPENSASSSGKTEPRQPAPSSGSSSGSSTEQKQEHKEDNKPAAPMTPEMAPDSGSSGGTPAQQPEKKAPQKGDKDGSASS